MAKLCSVRQGVGAALQPAYPPAPGLPSSFQAQAAAVSYYCRRPQAPCTHAHT